MIVLFRNTWECDQGFKMQICHQKLNRKEGRKEMFYLTMHSTHFLIYSYMASGIW